ncbi:unnamed protein product, partial [Polarella glacialis]
MHGLWLLSVTAVAASLCPAGLNEACDEDADSFGLLQVRRVMNDPASLAGSRTQLPKQQHALPTQQLATQQELTGLPTPQPLTVLDDKLPKGRRAATASASEPLEVRALQRARLPQTLQVLAAPDVALATAAIVLVFVTIIEFAPVRLFGAPDLSVGPLAASIFASVSLVGMNCFIRAGLEVVRIGILDIVYSCSVWLAFAGLFLAKMHPSCPNLFPEFPGMAALVLFTAFTGSVTLMLCIAAQLFAPASLDVMAIATQSGFGTLLKLSILQEMVSWEELSCVLGLLLAAVALGGCVSELLPPGRACLAPKDRLPDRHSIRPSALGRSELRVSRCPERRRLRFAAAATSWT